MARPQRFYLSDVKSAGDGWQKWNQDLANSSNTLEDALAWPGSASINYTVPPQNASNGNGADWRIAGFPNPVKGYMEPGDPFDQSLNIDDWIPGLTGSVNSNAVRDTFISHVQNKRQLRLIIWEDSQGTGNSVKYRIVGFGVFRILGFRLNQGNGNANGSWILAEFIKWDDSCGQVQSNFGVLP